MEISLHICGGVNRTGVTPKYLNAWSLESGTLGSVALEDVCLWGGGTLGFQKPKQGLVALSLPAVWSPGCRTLGSFSITKPTEGCHAPHHDSNGLNLRNCKSVPNKCFLYKSSCVMVTLDNNRTLTKTISTKSWMTKENGVRTHREVLLSHEESSHLDWN